MTEHEVGSQTAEVKVWPIRAVVWLESTFRPYQGWAVLVILLALSALPAFSLRVNRWVRLAGDQSALELVGLLSVLTVWLVAGWKRPRRWGRDRWWGVATKAVMFGLAGLLFISQLAIHWIPGPIRIVTALSAGEPSAIPAGIIAEWIQLIDRFGFWLSGVQSGTAEQDNLIFFLLASVIIWIVAGLSASIVRRYQSGFAGALPLLWLLGLILLYSSEGKLLFVFALALTVALHYATDQMRLVRRWLQQGLDYSPDIYLDRLMLVFGVSLLILVAAAVMPNLYVQALVDRYYQETQPVYEALEDAADRLFPGLRGTSRLGGGGLAGGLPNDFLLRAGPDLSDAIVMYVRTDDPVPADYPFDYTQPASHYMRGGTLSQYDGNGWSNSRSNTMLDIDANETMPIYGLAGRRQVVQQVALTFNTRVVYTAAEPLEVSTDTRLEVRSLIDAVALWARERSYTAVSMVPAVDEETLIEAGSWDDTNPLPEELQIHLELPETVPQRTIDLAYRLVEGQPSQYEKAQAIEAYLRTYEYDLGVERPPQDVDDVADYFLFELQRGYCDYYATAFAVLARSVGLPTRFATGFAPGIWNPEDGRWTITEAEAHSWPEVFFPEYGWIPFEPTAGRSELVRIGLPQSVTGGPEQPLPETDLQPEPEQAIEWNWQMLLWLLPIALLLWGIWRALITLRRRSEEPWSALLQWGGRIGRPIVDGETVLEYGDGLADYVVRTQHRRQDLARVAATEMKAMSEAVSDENYLPQHKRSTATERVNKHWRTLREYLTPLRRSR